jgi:hypothetical protein
VLLLVAGISAVVAVAASITVGVCVLD